ncbi:bifunctional hydroxymethylpyrimidine kinase/phosphomethylpyrimidine kinase [Rhodobacteraceae bacterium RKSG542]|uniref:bifunctional hydroxymethylpyrimidine kinase/phosphomethylpyrimidine kinase n=1 Tax=Pseudovibrio flavus TaxID=2529854 RepID=UPI0012BCAA82|nr:bifunctional hydroxymethylpyrimidine kinase/phosphomethylpyrimidine kinase [Pseudovibrio flavus]MTI19226.1 bifunctional hydroxymethylpyrimidine kinase/phosphomethylpyrimidine kinase [Pseudovibrio flavus]
MTAISVTIAGSDSGGGAGIQADLKTFSALGVYGASVLTALTAQNTKGVSAIHDVPPSFVTDQMEAVFTDLRVDSVKIGMLSQPDIIDAVADGLERFHKGPVVLDPVMVATSGDALLQSSAIETLKKRLFPLATLITPNMAEAAFLLGGEMAKSKDDMREQAHELLGQGVRGVLLKGGHGDGDLAEDLYLDRNGLEKWLVSPRHETRNTHGTGCSLSSAIAAGLAKGLPLDEALDEAKEFISGAIAAADTLKIGGGNGPVHHFYRSWEDGAQ